MMIKTFITATSALLFSSMAVVTAQTVKTGGSCMQYPTNGTCSQYVNYSVFLPSQVGLATVEQQLAPLTEFGTLLGAVSPDCFDAYARYSCSLAYPKCVTNASTSISVYTACTSTCNEVNQYCTALFTMSGNSHLLPNCSTAVADTGNGLQPDGACNDIPTNMTAQQIKDGLFDIYAIPAGYLITECPAPFVNDPLAQSGTDNTLDGLYCRYGCCIPCPAQNLFYKGGFAVTAFLVTDIIRFISAVLTFVLLVSYLVLPDKRRHPSLLILNMSLAVFLFSMVVFFSIGDPKRLQCAANGISPGQIGNNTLCAAQGSILIFGSLATVLWICVLILNLHMHTVWNNNIFSDKYTVINIVCWGIPTGITCAAIGLHAVKFEFANLCLVSMEYIFPLFFYPLAAIICPSFIIHIGTFFYIAKVAVREGLETDMTQSLSTGTMSNRQQVVSRKHVIVAVKIQWRALLLAIVAVVTVLFYWLFYMTQISKLTHIQKDPTFVLPWLQCMLTGNDQNFCADVIAPYIPPFPLMIVAEVLVSLVGIWIFIMFGKRSLWREWNDLIYDLRVKMNGGNRAEKNGEQFFAL